MEHYRRPSGRLFFASGSDMFDRSDCRPILRTHVQTQKGPGWGFSFWPMGLP